VFAFWREVIPPSASTLWQCNLVFWGGGYCSRVSLFHPEVSIVLCGGEQERSRVGRDAERCTSAHKVGTPGAWSRALRPGSPRWLPHGPELPQSSQPSSVTSNSLQRDGLLVLFRWHYRPPRMARPRAAGSRCLWCGGPSSSGSSSWSSGSSSRSLESSRPSSEPRPAEPRADFEKFGRQPRPRGSVRSRGLAGLRRAPPGSGPRPGGGARARPGGDARPGPRCAALRPRAGETRPPRTQKPPACSGRSGDVARPRGLPALPVLHSPARGRASGAGTQGARSPAPSPAPAQGFGAAASLEGSAALRGRVRQALHSPRALQGPVPPALRLPPAPRSSGPALPAALRGPRLAGSAQPVQGARAQCPAPRSPPPSKTPNPPNLSPAPLSPGLLSALQAPGPRAPRPSARPAPASPRKQQLRTSSQPPHASQSDFRKTLSEKAA
jgi:hypothetical protein